MLIDAIGSVLSAAGTLRDFPLEMREEYQDSAPSVLWQSKRTLARVFHQDGNLELSKSPSVFDIPWLEEDALDNSAEYGFSFDPVPQHCFREADRRWSRFYKISLIKAFFTRCLYGNADVRFGGRPLRNYFSSTDKMCSDPEAFEELARELNTVTAFRRLCISRGGLLGTVPDFTQLGDKISVLSKCDTPLILRPKGDRYEVAGTCFVEGLMKGEVAKGIEQGESHVEKICLC